AFASGIEKSALQNADIDKNLKQLKEIDKLQRQHKEQFKAQEDKVNDTTKALNRISAGVSERFNWQLLHQYINFATPQPNGDRLVVTSKRFEPVKDTYWTKDKDAQK